MSEWASAAASAAHFGSLKNYQISRKHTLAYTCIRSERRQTFFVHRQASKVSFACNKMKIIISRNYRWLPAWEHAQHQIYECVACWGQRRLSPRCVALVLPQAERTCISIQWVQNRAPWPLASALIALTSGAPARWPPPLSTPWVQNYMYLYCSCSRISAFLMWKKALPCLLNCLFPATSLCLYLILKSVFPVSSLIFLSAAIS